MDIQAQVGFHNKFELVLKSKVTGEIKQTAVAYNVVCDNYYNRIKSVNYWTDILSICVGTGIGTPAETDTALFSYLDLSGVSRGSVKSIQDRKKYSHTVTATFTETQANGLLTEVGLCQGSGYWDVYLCTHAMLQDEHGQQITINKTNTDVLIITATMYVELTLPTWIHPFPLRSDGRYYLCTQLSDEPEIPFDRAPFQIRRLLIDYNMHYVSSNNPGGWAFGFCKNCGPTKFITNRDTIDPGMYLDAYNDGVRFSCGTVLSSQWSDVETLQFKSICIYAIGIINFGDPNIFPFIDVERTAIADGTQTGFNFGIPELSENVSVYIDDVLQPSNSYTWNRKDYNCFQAYESCDGQYITELGTWNSGWSSQIGPYFCYGESTDGSVPQLTSDLGEVLTFRRSKFTGTNGEGYLRYSVDGNNWTTLTLHSGDNILDPPIQARYFKDNFAFQGYSMYWGGIGQGTDQLVFNNAPPANSVIKIKSQSPYPMKNSEWILQGMTFDFKLNKAT